MKNSKMLFLGVCAFCLVGGAVASLATQQVNSTDAMQRLTEGNRRFVAGTPQHPHTDPARRTAVAKSQAPFAVVLTCADSRVSPELVFDQGLGDLFVARVAGNTFGKDILGSIEYSVAVLGSRLIVVMGHERCGAVDAAIKGGELPGSIGEAINPILPAVAATAGEKENRLDKTIAVNAEMQAKRLLAESKILSDLAEKGELKVVSATLDLDTGVVTMGKP
ncbi:MAG: carbonic anhydrase [Armatimonadetes bacterium]|nr:carbonic anhydrase [Armatimonadota bacterium]MBS1711484.1 carbonic anhydrase [Armatimonadota bacterium]MBX3107591.1 carbonic anhydrase [Fimbriimonadaceae bacterium]